MDSTPFKITTKVLNLTAEIHELLGEMKNLNIIQPSVKLRRENKIKTIHHSLAIEGNELDEDQITAVLDKKRVLGPEKQILEVKNALNVYDSLAKFNPVVEKHLLQAHRLLMQGLVKTSGRYRLGQVGIFKGTKVSHMAPPAKQVPLLMANLFNFLRNDLSSWTIKACVFHYELEFIHPFEDGNGRMGRLWQQLLLMKHSRIFEFISTETLIHSRQKEYYSVLELCDRVGDSTVFLEFSLEIILDRLRNFNSSNAVPKPNPLERIQFAIRNFGSKSFSRKNYLDLFQELSTATASRDLSMAVEKGLLEISGKKARTTYTRKT